MMDAQETAAKSAQPLFTPWRLAFWAVLLVGFALYIPSLSGKPVWDDTQILSGEGIGGGTIAGAISQPFLHGYFRPLVSLTLLGEKGLFQDATFGFHLVNVLLHTATCAILMALLMACFKTRRIALIGGLIFAIHPLLVSTIGWIGGITDCLGSFLIALFAWTLIRGIQSQKSGLWIALSAAFFLLALFCKEQTIALILLVPLAQKAFSQSDEKLIAANYLKLLLPYALGAAFFLILWRIYFPGYPDIDRTLAERVQMVGQSLSYYALALLFPTSRWLQTYTLGSFAQSAWTWTVLGFALVVAFVWAWLKVFRHDPKLAWFGALLLLSIVPVANIVPPPSLVVAPYRAGLAVLGLAAVMGALIGRARHLWLLVPFAAYMVWYALLAGRAIPQWSDQRTLFTAMTQADPTFLNAKRNLAYTLMSAPGDQAANAEQAVVQVEAVLNQVYGSNAWQDPDRAVAMAMQDPSTKRQILLGKGPMDGNEWLASVFTQLAQARHRTGDGKGTKSALDTVLKLRGAL